MEGEEGGDRSVEGGVETGVLREGSRVEGWRQEC